MGSHGQEAIAAIEKFHPKITILDVDMPVMNGFVAAQQIKAKKLETEIIFLTMHRDEDLFNEAIDLGAKAAETERVVPVGPDLTLVTESRRTTPAREADVTFFPVETTSGGWGHRRVLLE